MHINFLLSAILNLKEKTFQVTLNQLFASIDVILNWRTLLIDAIVEKYCTSDRKMCKEVDGCGAILPAANISGFYSNTHSGMLKNHKAYGKLQCVYKIYLLEMAQECIIIQEGALKGKFSPLVAQTACQDFNSIFA